MSSSASHDPPKAGLREGAVEVLRRLRDAGHEALFAGGSVRDLVMGVEPKDYDIATSATPDEVMAVFERTVPVGVQFGVVRVLHGGHTYEVATFRADLGYVDGRRPEGVRWSSAREDVLRRDLTVNGLLLDPLTADGGGEVIDHVGGLDDIRRKLVRAIGDPDLRFEEDKLRLLRAVRFAARLHFAIDPTTWDAIRRRARQIEQVSPERIREELDRLVSEGGAERGLRLLEESGLLVHVLPEVPDPEAARARLHPLDHCPVEVGWTALLLDVEPLPQGILDLGRRLRFSTDRARHVAKAVETARALRGWESLGVARRKRLLREPEARTALRALPHVEAEETLRRWTAADLRPPRLLRGEDLAELGHAPGPAFKRALDAVEEAWLEGRVRTRDEALDVARKVLEGDA